MGIGQATGYRRFARYAICAASVALLWLALPVQAQAPEIDYGQIPAQWGGTGYGYWARSEVYQATGRAGYLAQLTSGEMVDNQGGETVVSSASLGVDSGSGEVPAGFGSRMASGFQCEPLDDGRPVAAQVNVSEGQFHGFPATVFTGVCSHPSYAYPDLACDMSGNCVPDTSSGIQANWQGGYTYLARVTCIEATPGGSCTLVIEEIQARTSGPATLGENAERRTFDALVAEVDAWKATWTLLMPGAVPGGQDIVEPAAPSGIEPVVVYCDTYCLNGVSVDSPFCDCAPATIPDEPDDDLTSLIVGLLTVLGVIGGGGFVITRLVRRRPKAPRRAAPPAERVLVDALGRKHRYVRDKDGRYINPQTGGELNEAQWQEYNQNLVENRKFSERERQKQAARQGSFDKKMDQMVEVQKQAQRDLQAIQRLERSLLFNPDRRGLWRGAGQPGDMYSNLKELRQQLEHGEEVDRRRLDAIRRLYRDHVQGTILTPDEMPSDMDYARDVLTGTLDHSLREIVTQQNADGGFSWKGMGLRLILNVATAGQVELALTPLESLYTMHDYVEGGGDSAWEGFLMTTGDVIKGEIMSYLGEAGARRLARLGRPKPQLPRARAPKGPPPSRYVQAKGVDIRTHMTGMPEANIRHVHQVAQKHNVRIMVRPTNPEARALLERGLGVPKPEFLKNKTINQLDTLLGASGDDLGKVGHFRPKLPPQASVPPELWQKVKNRYTQRVIEFHNQQKKIIKLVEQGKVIERNGVLYQVLEDGSTGRPFCGDHDLFEILDAHGRPCPESLKQHVIKELKKPPFSAQHPAHVDWDYSQTSRVRRPGGGQSLYEQNRNIDLTIRDSHGVGGEPLIEFQPGTMQPVQGAYYTGG